MAGNKKNRLLLSIIVITLFVIASVLVGIYVHSVSAGPQDVLPQPTQPDVTYCTAGGVALKMDIYAPAGITTGATPAVMFVHGGSWISGDKRGSEGVPEINELINRGYLVASIDYRLAPQFIFPAQIEDTKCAIRYVRANASSLNIDPNRIGAMGASAGGQLVSLLGTADTTAGLEGDGGYPNVSSRVQAVVDMYGRADLASVPVIKPELLPIFGGEANLAKFSPVTYVSPDDPPFLILHGEQDTTVPPGLSQEFNDRLRAAGVPVTLVMVKNAGHSFVPVPRNAQLIPSRASITRLVGDFFDKYLKGGSGSSAIPTPGAQVQAQSLPGSGQVVRFTQTGKAARGIFLDYWKAHGGLAQEGYPISDEMQENSTTDGRPYTVQYFERAVFEYHPENQAPYDVLTSLLGAQRYKSRYPGPGGAPGQRPNTSADAIYFERTGHWIGGDFLTYWQTHGGLMQQGYPISDEFSEVSPMDGKLYTVQYFERAVFELHPDYNEANRVLLSQLGTFKYKSKYVAKGNATPTAVAARTSVPTKTSVATRTQTPVATPTSVVTPISTRR